MRRSSTYNPKRTVLAPPLTAAQQARLAALAASVRYGGNPEHKVNPGDFGLTPPAAPRRGKSLCDTLAIVRRTAALDLLRAGLRHGLVDGRWDGHGWPRQVWAVDAQRNPVEAQLEADGVYHGYPMPEADPLREVVLGRWPAP